MKIDGFKAAIEALNGLPQADQNRIIAEIASKDPELAQRLSDGLFTFPDLANCNPNGLRELLSNTDENHWPIALRGAPMDVLDKIKESLSSRHYGRIIETMENIGPQRKSEIKKSRDEIMKVAKDLKDQGRLVISKATDSDPLV